VAELKVAPDLALPLDVTSMTSAILGVRGTGKTNTAGVLVEEAHRAGQRSIIIDPLDVWWGLKSSSDGERPGLPAVVFGGVHEDLPLQADHGALLADLVVETEITAVLSIAHLSKGGRTKFAADFFERLYQRKAEPEHRDRLLIVIDEASSFVPQTFASDLNMARCVGAVEDLVRRGRSRGIGVVLVDQRAASVNKNVLTQLEVLFAHRQVSPQDRAAIKSWVEASDDSAATRELVSSIASLGKGKGMTGEAWVWSPYLDLFHRTRIRVRNTFDSSATPKAGEVPKVPKKLAAADLDALRQRLSETIEEAEESDSKRLQARIKTLEKELAGGRPSDAVIAHEVALAVQPLEERNRHLEWLIDELRGIWRELLPINERINGILALEQYVGDVREVERSLDIPDDLKLKPEPAQAPKREGGVSGPQQRILDALASFRAIGVMSMSKGNVAVFSDQSPKSSGFRANLSALSSQGLISYGGEGVQLTPAGIKAAQKVVPPATLSDLHRAWMAKLSRPQGAMLRKLIDLYPDGIHRSTLANATNQSIKSSGYRANLSKLSGLGLIRYDGPEVVATPLLFPEGLK
jgi:uncharacterized protein